MTLITRRVFSMAALLGLTAVVGGLVWWQEHRGSAEVATKATAAKLFDFAEAVQIKALELHVGEVIYGIERVGEGEQAWQLRTPLRTLAEASTIESMLQAAIDLKMTARVGGGSDDRFDTPAPAPADLAIFGLAPPRFRLVLDDTTGRRQVLLVGKRNSFDGSLFVKRDDRNEVGVVPSSIEYQLERDAYALREKRPLIFTAEDVAALSISRGKAPLITLESQGGIMRMTAPLSAATDATAVAQLLSTLSGMRAQHFAAEAGASPTALQTFGLLEPEAVVKLTLASGAIASLRFGSASLPVGATKATTTPAATAKRTFVMLAGDNPVLELGSDAVLKVLAKPAQELRDLRVLPFHREDVQQVQMQRGGQTLTFVHAAAAADKEAWQQVVPAADGIDSSKVVALLYRLGDLKADAVVIDAPSEAQLAAHGLATPSLQIALVGAEGKSLGRLLVGRTEGGQRFVTTDAHARIDRLGAVAVDSLSTEPADYQAATAPVVPPAPAGIPAAPGGAPGPDPDEGQDG